jgi:hypothetical protein
MRDDSCEAMDNTDVREIERLRLRGTRSRGALEKEKPPVLGMIERGGNVVIRMLENVRLYRRGKKPASNTPGPPPQPSLPAVRRALIAALRPIICARCPNCGPPINLHHLE